MPLSILIEEKQAKCGETAVLAKLLIDKFFPNFKAYVIFGDVAHQKEIVDLDKHYYSNDAHAFIILKHKSSGKWFLFDQHHAIPIYDKEGKIIGSTAIIVPITHIQKYSDNRYFVMIKLNKHVFSYWFKVE